MDRKPFASRINPILTCHHANHANITFRTYQAKAETHGRDHAAEFSGARLWIQVAQISFGVPVQASSVRMWMWSWCHGCGSHQTGVRQGRSIVLGSRKPPGIDTRMSFTQNPGRAKGKPHEHHGIIHQFAGKFQMNNTPHNGTPQGGGGSNLYDLESVDRRLTINFLREGFGQGGV